MSDFFANLPRDEEAEQPASPPSRIDDAELRRLQDLCKAQLSTIPGVEGWAPSGSDRLKVYIRDESVAERLPSRFAGREIDPVVSGEIRAW